MKMGKKHIVTLILAALSLLGGAARMYYKKRLKSNNLAILGPKGSGKTTFLNYLRGINSDVSEGTGEEPYKSFIFTLENGEKIRIKDGKDIGGGSHYKGLYEKMIKNSNGIIIIFDVNRYLFDKKRNEEDGRTYEELAKVRFSFIRKTMNELNINIDSGHIAVIGSHKDETGKSDEEIKERFYQTIKEKPYRDALTNCHICDLTNEKELRKVVNDIFGKTIFTK